ncbi:MAG: hypothetical protein GY752_00940 [bacterium]|nr:hypothetical protein [bacterium]MCP4798493.1 hypothetical protein [bacterium]
MLRNATLIAFLLFALPALAATIYVPGDYAQIHDAVQAANSGDVVQVAAGTYNDCTHETEGPESTPACVIMKSGVTLRGAGPDATIIDAQGLGRGIFIEAVSNCSVENLQVRGAYAAIYGAGILIRQVGIDVTITDVTITENLDGGLICYDNASPFLLRLHCYDNEAKQGGGISVEEFSSPVIESCIVENNEAPSGAGIFIRNQSNATILYCTVTGNVINAAYGNGGGICVTGSNPIISGCEINGNTTLGYGGGVSFLNNSGGSLSNSRINDNFAIGDNSLGGGISVNGSTPLIEYCLIARNSLTGVYGDGGGVDCTGAPSATFDHCTIIENSTVGSAGGMFFQYGADPVIEHCMILNSTSGEGLYCTFGGTPTVSCSNVYGNPGGDAICGIDSGNNISADPEFCDLATFTPADDSPAADICGGYCGYIGPGCASGVETPASVHLLGNYPNPFNPSTTIAFMLDEPASAELIIRDVQGRAVKHITLGDLPAGRHESAWNGRDNNDRPAASGIYFYELHAMGMKQSRRMILIK